MTEETCDILQHFGYQFEQRGLVAVKGKGQLMTYYLQGKIGKMPVCPPPVSPILGVSTMETLAEEDESHDSPTPKSEDKTIIEAGYKSEEEQTFGSDADGPANQPLIKDDKSMDQGTENALLITNCDL